MNSDNLNKAIELINCSHSVLITTHNRLDGDACGCVIVMNDVLRDLGKSLKPILPSPVPQWYEFLFIEKLPILGKDVSLQQLKNGQFGSFDLIVIVDTNSYSQLGDFDQYLKQVNIPVLVFDHHITADGLGDIEIVDPTAAATGLIIFDLLKHADWAITEKIAEALFVAVATDTGWFQFNNTDSRAYRACAELIDAGVKPTEIYDKLYQNFSYSRFRLMVAMLNSIELHFDGQYAAQHLSLQDFEQTGADYEDTENLINECHRIGTVKVSALFIELKDGRIRCSLRSRGAVDVSQIAARFGGGGHKMAAGTYLSGPLNNAKQLIFEQVRQQLSGISKE
jgi:phosphoesterase RecJ-like protein